MTFLKLSKPDEVFDLFSYSLFSFHIGNIMMTGRPKISQCFGMKCITGNWRYKSTKIIFGRKRLIYRIQIQGRTPSTLLKISCLLSLIWTTDTIYSEAWADHSLVVFDTLELLWKDHIPLCFKRINLEKAKLLFF